MRGLRVDCCRHAATGPGERETISLPGHRLNIMEPYALFHTACRNRVESKRHRTLFDKRSALPRGLQAMKLALSATTTSVLPGSSPMFRRALQFEPEKDLPRSRCNKIDQVSRNLVKGGTVRSIRNSEMPARTNCAACLILAPQR